jgi:hypothetical protein
MNDIREQCADMEMQRSTRNATPRRRVPTSLRPREVTSQGSPASSRSGWGRIDRVVLSGTVVLCALWPGSTYLQASPFQWAKRIASTTDPDDEFAIGMTLDGAANIYLTGWFDGMNDFGGQFLTSAGGQDIFVAKYDSNAVLQWVRRAGGNSPGQAGCTGGQDRGRGIGVDADGNVYVTGGFLGDADFGNIMLSALQNNEFFLVKYDPSGRVQWAKQSMGGRSCGVYGTGLAVDGMGNSYAVGFADGFTDNGAAITFPTPCRTANLPTPAATGYSAFLVKYDTTGCVEWAELLGGRGQVYTSSVVVDREGNVYVCGLFSLSILIGNIALNATDPTGQARSMFLTKFDGSGTVLWAVQAGSADNRGGGVAVDQDLNVYVSGGFAGSMDFGNGLVLTSAGDLDAFIAKYDSTGEPQWAYQVRGAGFDTYLDVAVDQQGNAYAAGTFGPNVVGCHAGGAAVAKYSPDGALQWAYSASSPPAEPVRSVAAKCGVDAAGNCYLLGWSRTETSFGTIDLEPAKGSYWNLFLAKLGAPIGATVWSDDFDDNVRDNWWREYDSGASATGAWVDETNQRLEFTGNDPQEDSGVGYLLHAKVLDTANDFAVKVNWYLSVTSGKYTNIGLSVWPQGEWTALEAKLGAVWDENKSVFSAWVPHADPILHEKPERLTTSGTIYLSYNACLDRLHLSNNGYWQLAGSDGDWVVDGLIRGTWGAAAVSAVLGGSIERATVNGGEAWLDNFEITIGTLVDALRFRRGDCNDDGTVDISDGVCILNWLFLGGATPGCVAVTNTNGDAVSDISDGVFLLTHLFLGGPAPVAPFPECGPGTLPADEVTCETPPKSCQQ